MDPKQQEAFREAVDRKSEQAEEASKAKQGAPHSGQGDNVNLDATGQAQPGLQTDDRGNQDVFSVRDKNAGHGKKTADKWNQ